MGLDFRRSFGLVLGWVVRLALWLRGGCGCLGFGCWRLGEAWLGLRGVGLFAGGQGEAVLGGGDGVELGLGFVAEQADELGEGDGLLGGVDDGFDLGFQAQGRWIFRRVGAKAYAALSLEGTGASISIGTGAAVGERDEARRSWQVKARAKGQIRGAEYRVSSGKAL